MLMNAWVHWYANEINTYKAFWERKSWYSIVLLIMSVYLEFLDKHFFVKSKYSDKILRKTFANCKDIFPVAAFYL